MADLQTWCDENHLSYNKIDEQIVEISGGKYLLVVGAEEERLFDREMKLLLSYEEIFLIIDKQLTAVVYEFGDKFYYTKFDYEKLMLKFNESDVFEIDAAFEDLKHIGKSTQKFIPFAHLGIHSEYELLNGCHIPKQWVTKAKFLGMSVIGICDVNTLAGTLPLQVAAIDKGIRCVIGETITIRYTFDEKGRLDENHECKLYVKNETGWRNLLRINKIINVDNHRDPHITEADLIQYTEGLIFVFSTNSIINSTDSIEEMSLYIELYKEVFQEVYYQIDTVEFDSDEYDIQLLDKYKQMRDLFSDDIEFVLINDSYYIDPDYATAKKYVNAISGKQYAESSDQYFKSATDSYNKLQPLFEDEEELEMFFSQIVENANKIAEKCVYQISTGRAKLPKFEAVTMAECGNDKKLYEKRRAEFAKKFGVSDVDDNNEIFFQLLSIGCASKLKNMTSEQIRVHHARLETEADLIVNAGFVDYFLMLWDVIQFCQRENIMVGVGRGSVGGSLLAFLLDITDIDPIPYDLLFERFMNKVRAMPEEVYIMELENDKSYKIPLNAEVKLITGKMKKVNELTAGDDVDLEYCNQWEYIK